MVTSYTLPHAPLFFPSDLVNICGDLEHAHLQRQHAVLCRQHLHHMPQPWPSALLDLPAIHACQVVWLAKKVFAPQQAERNHVCTTALHTIEQDTIAHCCAASLDGAYKWQQALTLASPPSRGTNTLDPTLGTQPSSFCSLTTAASCKRFTCAESPLLMHFHAAQTCSI